MIYRNREGTFFVPFPRFWYPDPTGWLGFGGEVQGLGQLESLFRGQRFDAIYPGSFLALVFLGYSSYSQAAG